MERSFLGLNRSDRVRNTTTCLKTGIIDVGEKAARLKWDWTSQPWRKYDNRWAQACTQWLPKDGRTAAEAGIRNVGETIWTHI